MIKQYLLNQCLGVNTMPLESITGVGTTIRGLSKTVAAMSALCKHVFVTQRRRKEIAGDVDEQGGTLWVLIVLGAAIGRKR